MLSYNLNERNNLPLYEFIYKSIKNDIISGKLAAEEKLPSKRKLAENLHISVITVENAYSMLLSEGYIYSVEKSGYYVSHIAKLKEPKAIEQYYTYPEKKQYEINMKSSRNEDKKFPVASWCRIARKVLTEKSDELFNPCGFAGCTELRQEIAKYLSRNRSLDVSPDCIIIGAGTEYLCGLIIRLLGSYKVFGLENPGYKKVASLYKTGGARCFYLNLDSEGISTEELRKSPVEVLHISPNHHYPTGKVTSASRRYELLEWANERDGRYIIEDDYDSELRFDSYPLGSMRAEDKNGKVIYMNTFSKTISPSLRVGYLVLPRELMELYVKKFECFSCTVSLSEQYILADFIGGGYYERHISGLKRFYMQRRNAFFLLIAKSSVKDKVQITEEISGLHFILELLTETDDFYLSEQAEKEGILLSFLSDFSTYKDKTAEHKLVVNYGSLSEEQFKKVLVFLSRFI